MDNDQQPTTSSNQDDRFKTSELMVDNDNDHEEGEEDEFVEHVKKSSGKVVAISQPNKKAKTGVVYLSSIPDGLDDNIIRNMFQCYGEVRRIYLEPYHNRKGKRKAYVEGWVEFAKKRVAKEVANILNGQSVGGKRKNKTFHDCIWSMKYLHRFKWHDLHAHMNYERTLRQQRMRSEFGQVRKESEFYAQQLSASKAVKKYNVQPKADDLAKRKDFYSKKQRFTESEVNEKLGEKTDIDNNFLSRIFN